MLTFDGVQSTGKFKVMEVRRSILPPSENKFQEFEGKSGAMFLKRKHGMKQIDVDIIIQSESMTSLRADVRDIADWLDTDEPRELVFTDEADKKDFAILDGNTDLDEIVKIGFGTITFLCPSPYSIGAEVTENLASGGNTINYLGTRKTFPKLTVDFSASVSSFSITNGTETLELLFDFGTTTTVEIDMDTGKIEINGTPNLQSMTLESDFFPIEKGVNDLTVSTSSTVVLTYNELFI